MFDVDDFLEALRRGGRRRHNARPEVLAVMAEGRTNRGVAQKLWLTDRTVETPIRLRRPRDYRGGMAETQRESVPRVDTGELNTALAFLSFARHCVLKKADGLSEEQLRRVLVESGTSILGLVQHLAEAERYWFGYHLVGTAWSEDQELGMTVPADRTATEVLRDYQAAIEDSDRAILTVGDPDGRFAIPVEGNRFTLRWVMAHMTSETARHAGHADILREQIDGTTGR